MKESGWLTRSLEQNIPYNLDFPGKISSKKVKRAFLEILNDIETNNVNPEDYVKGIFYLSIKNKNEKSVQIINPIKSESNMNIQKIMELLEKHFYYPYKSRGASILPVIALYSIYQCFMIESKRFENKKLKEIASHYSSDRSSGNAGDIVISNDDNSLYEVVEVKFDIKPNLIMIQDAYKKFSNTTVQRYYILSILHVDEKEKNILDELINNIKKEHGCQVIINGIFETIRYYLRTLENTDKFIEFYIENLKNNPEINAEHKLSWNIIMNTKEY